MVILDICLTALASDRKKLLMKRGETDRIICSLSYINMGLKKCICKNWYLLENIPLCDKKLMIAFRRTKNLTKQLIHSNIHKLVSHQKVLLGTDTP